MTPEEIEKRSHIMAISELEYDNMRRIINEQARCISRLDKKLETYKIVSKLSSHCNLDCLNCILGELYTDCTDVNMSVEKLLEKQAKGETE